MDAGLSPRDVSTHVRSLLRALEVGSRPGRKTTATQLRRLAAALELEAVRRDRAGADRSIDNGALPVVWVGRVREGESGPLSDGDHALIEAEARFGPGAEIRVTVERVA